MIEEYSPYTKSVTASGNPSSNVPLIWSTPVFIKPIYFYKFCFILYTYSNFLPSSITLFPDTQVSRSMEFPKHFTYEYIVLLLQYILLATKLNNSTNFKAFFFVMVRKMYTFFQHHHHIYYSSVPCWNVIKQVFPYIVSVTSV